MQQTHEIKTKVFITKKHVFLKEAQTRFCMVLGSEYVEQLVDQLRSNHEALGLS